MTPGQVYRYDVELLPIGQVAVNTVFHDRMRPSHVVLPVYPLDRGR